MNCWKGQEASEFLARSLLGAVCAILCQSMVVSTNAETLADPTFRAIVVDAGTEKPIPARVYVKNAAGDWFHVSSADGQTAEYHKQSRISPQSVEIHTSVSAHEFSAALPAGNYTVRIERGKEYLPLEEKLTIGETPVTREFRLRRWINMAERGWYSGDTHVHRSIADLPVCMLAEDLNVAFPLTSWATRLPEKPAVDQRVAGTASFELVFVDATHVIQPRNTEYEYGVVAGQPKKLGAFLILNHAEPLSHPAFPLTRVAQTAREQKALIDIDKHSWLWSLMIVPVMEIDLFELSNNHVWQTPFGFPEWTIETVPAYMNIERTDKGFTEWGWIDYGFQSYYALVNCGFRLRVSAGNASGVHPVPLGFGRVYAYLPEQFHYQDWIESLNAGHSFVSNGPMLDVRFNGQLPGTQFTTQKSASAHISGTAESRVPLSRIEVIVNGAVEQVIKPENRRGKNGAYLSQIDWKVTRDSSFWVAVRCFEDDPDRRIRFAHTNPVYFDIPGKPVRPSADEVKYLKDSVQTAIDELTGLLEESSLAEFRQALRIYEKLATQAE